MIDLMIFMNTPLATDTPLSPTIFSRLSLTEPTITAVRILTVRLTMRNMEWHLKNVRISAAPKPLEAWHCDVQYCTEDDTLCPR